MTPGSTFSSHSFNFTDRGPPPGTAASVELIKQRLTASLTPLEKGSLCFPERTKDYSVVSMGTPKHVSSHLLGRVSLSKDKTHSTSQNIA